MSLALVLAGGGERAIAWERGVLAGLELPEPDLVVGTSAGSHVASGRLVTAAEFAAAVEVWLSAAPEERRRRVGALALAVEESWPAALRLVAVEARTGEPWCSAPVTACRSARRSRPRGRSQGCCRRWRSGTAWQEALEEEISALERAGSQVLLIQAGPEDQAAMGLDFMSAERAGEAFTAGQSRGAAAAVA